MKAMYLAVVGLLTATPVSTQKILDTDRIRIAEAARLADALGNRLWPDWDAAPFAVLLVTADHEFLVNHPKPSADFAPTGEELLKQKVLWRKRTYNPDLLATFPAVGGVPTVVVGRAEKTSAKTSTRWVVTLLHEHFHQLQNSQPWYYADVDALGLARGDKTGGWMLNYDFPYAKAAVKDQFAIMCKALAAALTEKDHTNFEKAVETYREAKKTFQSLLTADDYKYLAFQSWQEGVARYTEYRVAAWAAKEYEPSQAFRELTDYTPFKDEVEAILKRIEKELSAVELDKAKRAAFYALGAGEALVLDRINPDWRKKYFEEKFSLDAHFRAKK